MPFATFLKNLKEHFFQKFGSDEASILEAKHVNQRINFRKTAVCFFWGGDLFTTAFVFSRNTTGSQDGTCEVPQSLNGSFEIGLQQNSVRSLQILLSQKLHLVKIYRFSTLKANQSL